jgi:hypothetical protein
MLQHTLQQKPALPPAYHSDADRWMGGYFTTTSLLELLTRTL